MCIFYFKNRAIMITLHVDEKLYFFLNIKINIIIITSYGEF